VTAAANGSGSGGGYTTIEIGGSSLTQRATLNFASGTGITQTCVDNSGASRTDCTPSLNTTYAPSWQLLQSGQGLFIASSNGNDAYSGNTNPILTGTRTKGGVIFLNSDVASASTHTLNDGISTVTIDQIDGSSAPVTGQIAATSYSMLIWDGSVYRLFGTVPVYDGNSAHCLSGISTWVACSGGGGSGTVNPGTVNQLSYYGSTGSAVSGLSVVNSAVVVTSSGGVPSESTTLPSGLTIPGYQASLTLTTTGSSGAATLTGGTLNIPIYTGGSGVSIGGTVTSGTTNYLLYVGSGPVLAQEQFLAAAQFPALTGDLTTTAGALATTLATVNSNVGSFTNANLTVNAKGLVTAVSSGTGGSGTSTDILLAPSVVDSPLIFSTLYCSSGVSPALCGAFVSGSVAIPTGANPTLVVDDTAVIASSRIVIAVDDTTAPGGVTCNSTLATLAISPVVTARTPGTSFTLSYSGTITTNPVCVNYVIYN